MMEGFSPQWLALRESCDATAATVSACDPGTTFLGTCTGYAAAFSRTALRQIGDCAQSSCPDIRTCLTRANCWLEAGNPAALPLP